MPKWDLFGFVDESGTAGVRTSDSDNYLVLSLVIFRDEKEMKSVHKRYVVLRKELRRKDTAEFHYTHDREKTRDKVFDVMQEINFEFMTFAVKKDSVKRHASYAMLAEMMVNWLAKKNAMTKILIDTNPVLLKELNKSKKLKNLKNIRFQQEDSTKVDCLQLADYVVGAHSKTIRGQKENNFEKIKNKLKILQIYDYD